MISHIGWEENESPFVMVWKPFSSRRVMRKSIRKNPKSLRGSPEGKT